jgi:hypothetical protein
VSSRSLKRVPLSCPLAPSPGSSAGWTLPSGSTSAAACRSCSKMDEDFIAAAQQTGGDDLPWDTIHEYQQALAAGSQPQTQALLKRISSIVNGGQ